MDLNANILKPEIPKLCVRGLSKQKIDIICTFQTYFRQYIRNMFGVSSFCYKGICFLKTKKPKSIKETRHWAEHLMATTSSLACLIPACHQGKPLF